MIPKECKRLAEAMLAFIGNFTAWEMSSNPTFVEISRGLVKATVSEGERPKHEMESAIRQLVSRAAYSADVVDVFAAAGLEKPDIRRTCRRRRRSLCWIRPKCCAETGRLGMGDTTRQ